MCQKVKDGETNLSDNLSYILGVNHANYWTTAIKNVEEMLSTEHILNAFRFNCHRRLWDLFNKLQEKEKAGLTREDIWTRLLQVEVVGKAQ